MDPFWPSELSLNEAVILLHSCLLYKWTHMASQQKDALVIHSHLLPCYNAHSFLLLTVALYVLAQCTWQWRERRQQAEVPGVCSAAARSATAAVTDDVPQFGSDSQCGPVPASARSPVPPARLSAEPGPRTPDRHVLPQPLVLGRRATATHQHSAHLCLAGT